MSCDGFQTSDIPFSAVLCYLYTFDALLRVDIERGHPTFQWSVPSEDAKILLDEWAKDEVTVQASSFIKAYSRLTQKLRDMKRQGDVSWVSRSWIEGKGK